MPQKSFLLLFRCAGSEYPKKKCIILLAAFEGFSALDDIEISPDIFYHLA